MLIVIINNNNNNLTSELKVKKITSLITLNFTTKSPRLLPFFVFVSSVTT